MYSWCTRLANKPPYQRDGFFSLECDSFLSRVRRRICLLLRFLGTASLWIRLSISISLAKAVCEKTMILRNANPSPAYGVVYRARDKRNGRIVALKTVRIFESDKGEGSKALSGV